MARAKRTTRILNVAIGAGASVDVTVPVMTVEYALRVVDAATFAGVAFTYAYASLPHDLFHFAAGESVGESDLCLAEELKLQITGPAGASRLELILWAN